MGLESQTPTPGARKYSALPHEIEEVRKEAVKSGKDPEEAVAAFLQKFEEANARVAEQRKDESGPRTTLH